MDSHALCALAPPAGESANRAHGHARTLLHGRPRPCSLAAQRLARSSPARERYRRRPLATSTDTGDLTGRPREGGALPATRGARPRAVESALRLWAVPPSHSPPRTPRRKRWRSSTSFRGAAGSIAGPRRHASIRITPATGRLVRPRRRTATPTRASSAPHGLPCRAGRTLGSGLGTPRTSPCAAARRAGASPQDSLTFAIWESS